MTAIRVAVLGLFGCYSDNGSGSGDGAVDAADRADASDGGNAADDGGEDMLQPQPGTITVSTAHRDDPPLVERA